MSSITENTALTNYPKSNDLSISRLYRSVQLTGINNNQAQGEEYYSLGQGFTYTEGDEAVYTLLKNAAFKSDIVKLVKVNVKTGQVLQEKILELGHANNLSFNKKDRILYSSNHSRYVDGVDEKYNAITVIDYDTLSIQHIVEFDVIVSSVSYDNENNVLYVGPNTANRTIYKLNNDFSIASSIDLEIPASTGATKQGFDIHNNLIYFVSYNPNTMHVFDMEGKNVINYSFSNYANSVYWIGEIEDISHVDRGKFYIYSTQNMGANPQHTMVSIFEIDLEKNVLNVPLKYNRGNSGRTRTTVYVDSAAGSINPDGSSANPFTDLQEAVNYLNTPYCGGGRIYVYSGVYNRIYFTSAFGTIQVVPQSDQDVTINGVAIVESNHVVLRGNPKIKHTNPSDKAAITMEYSSLTLGDCVFLDKDINLVSCAKSRLYKYGTHSYSLTDPLTTYFITLDAGSCLFSGSANLRNIYYASRNGIGLPGTQVLTSGQKIFYGDVDVYADTQYLIANAANFQWLDVVYTFAGRTATKSFKMSTGLATFAFTDSNIVDSSPDVIIAELTLKIVDGKFTVTHNRNYRTLSGIATTKTDNTDSTNFLAVTGIYLHN